jgi:hypothetical protein
MIMNKIWKRFEGKPSWFNIVHHVHGGTKFGSNPGVDEKAGL